MKTLLIVLMLGATVPCSPDSSQLPCAPKLESHFFGTSLMWIHAVEPELHRRNIDLENYFISVDERQDPVHITFYSVDEADARLHGRTGYGSFGKYPAFEILINKKDSRILRFSFIR